MAEAKAKTGVLPPHESRSLDAVSPDVELTSERTSLLGPRSAPFVYVVVLNYNGAEMTVNCAQSVLRLDYPNFRVLIVDNDSTDDSVRILSNAFRDRRVDLLVNEKNWGYAQGNNRGIEKALSARADYIFLLNNDTIVNPGCLSPLVEAMEQDAGLGIAGCPIIDLGPDPLASSHLRVNLFTGRVSPWSGGDVDYVYGAALLIRADTVKQIGLFDSRFFMYWEETDLCFRARWAGYKLRVVPSPGIQHLGSQTAGRSWRVARFYYYRNRAWFIRRHGTWKHKIIFNLYSFCNLYPRMIRSYLKQKQFDHAGGMLRAIWEGHFEYPGPYRDDSVQWHTETGGLTSSRVQDAGTQRR